MKTVAILPLDDRPVNYDYPQILARAAGVRPLVPPREWLGNPWRPARRAEIARWLFELPHQADALILSIDTLAYGGLIPMRTSDEPFEKVRERLALVEEIKKRDFGLRIYASSVIQRVCRANSSEEEKPYWAEYGARMFRLSYLEHKCSLNEGSREEENERDDLRRQIPNDVYDDYRAIRARNYAVNRLMLDWAEKDILDELILPQDDTAEYGWNIAEARELQAHIRARGIEWCAITYPGADEIGSLLLAAWLCFADGMRPRVFPRFSSSSSATVITAYEDRPMPELIKAHLSPLGGILADSPEDADIVLFVNAPAISQGVGEYQWLAGCGPGALGDNPSPELSAYAEALMRSPDFLRTRAEMETPLRSPEEFCRAVRDSIWRGRVTAVADVAFVNGADALLCQNLVINPDASRLAGYAGWNTAGNTLGTVLAQAIIRAIMLKAEPTTEQVAAHLEFLFTRFLDDYFYQAVERSRMMLEDLPALGLVPTEERLPDDVFDRAEQKVVERLSAAAKMLERIFRRAWSIRSIEVSNIHLPWRRLFEVGFDVKIDLEDPAPSPNRSLPAL